MHFVIVRGEIVVRFHNEPKHLVAQSAEGRHEGGMRKGAEKPFLEAPLMVPNTIEPSKTPPGKKTMCYVRLYLVQFQHK